MISEQYSGLHFVNTCVIISLYLKEQLKRFGLVNFVALVFLVEHIKDLFLISRSVSLQGDVTVTVGRRYVENKQAPELLRPLIFINIYSL